MSKVYKTSGDTEETLEEKAKYISKTLQYVNVNHTWAHPSEAIIYKFRYSGEWKYIVFGDINLLRTRLNGSQRKETVNKLGFIINSNVFEGSVEEERTNLLSRLYFWNIVIITTWFFLSLLITIMASRHIADRIYNKIIDFSIQMTIAKNEMKKLEQMQPKFK